MKRLWRQMVLAGMAGVMILGMYGCGNSEGSSDAEPETELGAPEDPEESTEPETPSDEPAAPDLEAESAEGSASRKEGNENLNGDILELGDGQFTVVASESEETDDGGAILVAPAEGSDVSDFAQVSVSYDEDTDIYIRMIYDNGARYEDTDGSAEDLSRDDMVLVWGTCGAGQTTIQADQIQINRFVR